MYIYPLCTYRISNSAGHPQFVEAEDSYKFCIDLLLSCIGMNELTSSSFMYISCHLEFFLFINYVSFCHLYSRYLLARVSLL